MIKSHFISNNIDLIALYIRLQTTYVLISKGLTQTWPGTFLFIEIRSKEIMRLKRTNNAIR